MVLVGFVPVASALSLVAALHGGLPIRAPSEMGMSSARLEAIDRIVTRGINAGGFPGASVVVGRKGASVWEKGFGRLSWGGSYDRVTPSKTIYDLASLSKVIGTTTAIMVLYDEGKISLDAPVSRYIPEFSGGLKDLVTIRQLLTHRSGLPAGRDIWTIASSAADARRLMLATELEYPPGTRYVYSDLGADVLAMVAEAVSGERLDVFLQARVFAPIGMNDTFYNPEDSLRYRIAPTEVNPPRGYPLQGEVHDENAFAMGGIAGHAGLFSTASDLSMFAQMMLNGGVYDGVRVLSDSTVSLFTRRTDGTRALGWDTADGDLGSGDYLSDRAYGHTGFTGTSIWIDPDREMFVILLTNRVNEARAKRPARVIADVRSDLSDAAALAVIDGPEGPMDMPGSFRADRELGWNPAPPRARHARGRKAGRTTVAARTKAARAKVAKAKAARSSHTARASESKSRKHG